MRGIFVRTKQPDLSGCGPGRRQYDRRQATVMNLLELLALVVPTFALMVVSAFCITLVFRQRSYLERLAESTAHFQLLFEHCGVGLALLDLQGHLLEVNPTLAHFLGYAPAELKGQPLNALYHPNDAPTQMDFLLTATEEQQVCERERRYRRKDGKTVWANVLRVPVRKRAGQVQFIVAVLVDITERKQMEGRLREERDLSRQILDTTDALLVVLGRDGRIQRVNQKTVKLTGLHEDRVRGALFWDELAVPAERERLRQQLTCIHEADGRSWRGDVLLPTAAGRPRLIHWHIHADSHEHWMATGVDVTEQRRLEGQLQQIQKMETLGTLVGGIAHDFNNQFTAILGYLDLIAGELREALPPESYRAVSPLLKSVDVATQRCATTTRSLLVFSRRRTGKTQQAQLNQLLRETQDLLRRVLPASIALELLLDEDAWPVQADVGQLQQVLIQLASNARDAMPEGGLLCLETDNQEYAADIAHSNAEARPGRFVRLVVRDTGVGIAPEMQARIFEPFFTTKAVGQGTGLGLAMVFGIVKAHNGWISVESQPGQGTAFSLFLPAAPPEAAPPTELSAPPTAALIPHHDHQRILVVDDEEPLRFLARALLEAAGYRVLTAADGREALEMYQQPSRDIDLILLDLTMPRLSGTETLRLLKQINPDVRVVICSGYAAGDDHQTLLRQGARAVVSKPYRPDDLTQAIQQALQ